MRDILGTGSTYQQAEDKLAACEENAPMTNLEAMLCWPGIAATRCLVEAMCNQCDNDRLEAAARAYITIADINEREIAGTTEDSHR